MRKTLVTMAMATAILATGSLLSVTAKAAPTASHSAIKVDKAFETVAVHKRTHRHAVRQSSGEITSFSSSSVGVNHPAKK